MTTRYVGAGGNDANTGLSWAQRKLTLNGVENTPVQAGDTVYVGAGTYREELTCNVDGSAGNLITYIGDYDGSHTDGTGGVVRITGSNDDKTAARNYCINGNDKDYRAFTGFRMSDSTNTSGGLVFLSNAAGWVISNCIIFCDSYGVALFCNGANQANNTIQNCIFFGILRFSHTSLLDNSGHVLQNCIFIGRRAAAENYRVGGETIRNCGFYGCYSAALITYTLNAGQTLTINNSVFAWCNTAISAPTGGNAYVVENYNSISECGAARSNVDVGANSNAYPANIDTRWFFELVNGGSMLSPFDLASYSQLINVAGTNPTTTDMRGTAVQGTQREWGALEYDSTLDIEAGTGGGAVSISPIQGEVAL